MKRFVAILAALAALPLAAQQAAAPAPAKQEKIVATVNGEKITQEKLNQLYERLGTQMRAQYEKSGGKQAFLENYLRKRLMIQEAMKSGFDKRPEIQAEVEAAKESAIFDRYVRDVVAENIVNESLMRKYYDEHQDEFKTPEMVHVYHIVIVPNGAGPRPKSEESAKELIQKAATEIRMANVFPKDIDEDTAARLVREHFMAAAKKYSEDGVAEQGGDLGWNPRGVFDKDFEDAAFGLRKGMVSGIIKTRFGYHLIYVDGKKGEGTEKFEDAKPALREMLMTAHAADVMTAVTKLTNELRQSSRIQIYPDNIQ